MSVSKREAQVTNISGLKLTKAVFLSVLVLFSFGGLNPALAEPTSEGTVSVAEASVETDVSKPEAEEKTSILSGALAPSSPKTAAKPSHGVAITDILTVFTGLGLVVLVIVGCGWFLKRTGGLNSGPQGSIKILASLAVGTKERIALIQVGEQQVLIGITPQQITTLHTLAEPLSEPLETKNNSEFAQKLHHLISSKEKR